MWWLEGNVIGLIHICCSWSFIFWMFWQNIPCFAVSAFTISLSYENIVSQNSQSTRRSLDRRGLYSAGSLNVFPNLINGWIFLINKGSENSSLSKQVFCLYKLKSYLWKLQVILHNQVYFRVHPLFCLVEARQQSCNSTTSPWWWLLYQTKHWRNLNKLGWVKWFVFFLVLIKM